MIVVVTRLSPRGLSGLRHALALSEQTASTLPDLPGFLGGRLRLDLRRDMWTLTAWQDRASLAAFREAHLPVMARADEVAREEVTTAWQQPTGPLPDWTVLAGRWPHGRLPGRGISRSLAASAVATT